MAPKNAKGKRNAPAARGRQTRAARRSQTSSRQDSSSLSPVKSIHTPSEEQEQVGIDLSEVADGEDGAPSENVEDLIEGMDLDLAGIADPEAITINPAALAGLGGAPTADSQDGDGDDGEDDDEDEDEGDEEEEEEEEEDDDDEEDEDEDDEDEDEDEEDESGPSFRYPPAVPDWTKLDDRERLFKAARFMSCQVSGCHCDGLQPPEGADLVVAGAEGDEDGEMGEESGERTSEGWWRICGNCGHGWEAGKGHVFPPGLTMAERNRRGKVVGRIEEFLQENDQLLDFPTPHPESLSSLFKQLHQFQRPAAGKKPVAPLPPALDLRGSNSPSMSRDGGTPVSDDERPRKRSRRSGTMDADGEEKENADVTSPRKAHGKRPGKTSTKGTKPRTVVRGSRGLVPMEIDAEGNQHVGGRLPDSAADGPEDQDGADEEEQEEEGPVAKRPELDEAERKRREMIKEKAKERENEVLRRLNNEAVEGDKEGGRQDDLDVEVWNGVELTKLPPREAALDEMRNEIMLTVVASRNPTPVALILLVGLKNLFQRQLPKMPREYITRLVLDKNHISMAIVKRGWKVVGGVCYRPFDSRGFAEIVFCAVESSEQSKGYGSHLMNSLKDHVRKTHPTINHFLTYADNYAVGYFKKQGFTKEINFDRERWVGYIKDYEGGTIMHCRMIPKVRYLEARQILADQKAAVMAKIRTISKSHIVHPGLQAFKDRKKGQEIKLTKADVPGLAESGWDPDLDEVMRQPKRNPDHVYLQLVLDDLQNEACAWPFLKPVDGNVVADYYEVIKDPMDLATMEHKLENNHYASVDDFIEDAQLIFHNARQYNGEKSTYVKNANKLEKALMKALHARKTTASE